MDKRIDVAGLQINAFTKSELFRQLEQRIASGAKTFITTPYSEFLYRALRDREVMHLLNSADIAVADGVGVIWAQYFLVQPTTAKSFYGRILQTWWQVVHTGAQILLQPKKLYQTIPEKIVGADLIWDLSAFAEKHNLRMFLAGGYGETPEKVKSLLTQHYPDLKVVGTSNARPGEQYLLEQIRASGADIVLVAFGPITQERWIAENLKALPAKIAIGLGGTFDYLVGERKAPPKFIRQVGLEWLYRLLTQPSRVGRIYNAFWGLIISLVRYKVFNSYPFRENGLAIVVNQENKVLLCRRAFASDRVSAREQAVNQYWQFPQGGLDEGESVEVGTQRELYEETGISSVEILGLSEYINSYSWNNAKRPLLGRSFNNPGQEQRTVFFRFSGDDSEIKLDTRELIDYQWLSPEELLEKIADERRPHARKVLEELAQLLENKVQ